MYDQCNILTVYSFLAGDSTATYIRYSFSFKIRRFYTFNKLVGRRRLCTLWICTWMTV